MLRNGNHHIKMEASKDMNNESGLKDIKLECKSYKDLKLNLENLHCSKTNKQTNEEYNILIDFMNMINRHP